MPLTLPTHPVAVLPLKLWRPRWFDGVALVLGSIAPDIAYAADGYGVTIHSHAWHAALWWALPLTLLGARLVRWAAPIVVAHLPGGGPLALRDYGVLAAVRHPWWDVLSAVSDLIGFAVGIVLVLQIGRARLLCAWHGPAPVLPSRPARFWPVVGAVLVVGVALLPVQPVTYFPDQAVRAMLIVGLALLGGAVVARPIRRPAMVATPRA